MYSGNVYIWVKITLTARVHTHAFPEITVSLAASLVEWGISSRRQIDLLSVTALIHFQKTSTHWGRVMHICVSKLTIIGSDNGLSPDRRQAIIWTNAEILLIGPLWTNFNETSIEIHTFLFKKIHLKLSSGKWRPFCLGFNVLTEGYRYCHRVSLSAQLILNQVPH